MTTNSVKEDFDKLDGTIGVFLGFRPSSSDLAVFPFQIYSFIIRRIRQIDETLGTALIRRFLDGPQEVWVRMDKRAQDLLDIFDPEKVEARFLPSLRKLVAFGDDLLDVVNAASEAELRVIIAGAIQFWQNRALRESGYQTAIDLVTGNRFKIRGYHDFKFILGETPIQEELQDLDPFMLDIETVSRFRKGDDGASQFGANTKRFSAASGNFVSTDVDAFIVIQDISSPGSNGFFRIASVISTTEVEVEDAFPTAETGLTWFTGFEHDEFITEIRLVDDITGDGAINRDLVRRLLDLTRPNSERVNIVYVSFMDLFTTPNDLGQWQVEGTDDFDRAVSGGVMTLDNGFGGGELVTDYFNDDTWKNYSLKSKVTQTATGSWEISFLRTDDDNNFFIRITFLTPTNGDIRLFRKVGGFGFQLGSTFAFTDLALDIPFTYTIDVFRDEIAVTTNIEIRIDGDLVISESEATYEDGNLGYRVNSGTAIDVDEIELWQYPLTIDRVGPNP